MDAVSIRAELAAAVRRVNARLHALPEDARPDLRPLWRKFEAEVDGALTLGGEENARAAIERWERAALTAIAEAA